MTSSDTAEAASFADHPVLHLSVVAVVLVVIAGAVLVRRFRR